MLKSEQDIKNFINWCRKNKVKSFSCEGVAFELSELAFIEGVDEISVSENSVESAEEANLDSEQDSQEEKDLLFWSSN